MPIIPVLEGSKQKNQEESSSVQGTNWVGDQHGLPESLPQKQMKLVGTRHFAAMVFACFVHLFF